MKILYLSGSYVPSRRASSVHVMHMCQAMSHLGHDVTLITKKNSKALESDIANDFDYYGVDSVFEIKKFIRPLFIGGGIINTIVVWLYLIAKGKKFDIIYARDITGAWGAVKLGLPVILELHGVPPDGFIRGLYMQIIAAPSLMRLVVISEGLNKDLEANHLKLKNNRLVVAHDGALSRMVDDYTSPAKLSDGKLKLGYVGQLFPGKGMEVVLPLAELLPDVSFHVIGGQPKDLLYWQEQSPPQNVEFHGFVIPGEVKRLYRQFDILLLPPQKEVYGASGRSDISRWMSPLKMFEYMATGVPIISSDLPVLKEVLTHEKNALLVAPEDIDGWKTAVRRLQSDPELAVRLGKQAQKDLQSQYTWGARAKKVLEGL